MAKGLQRSMLFTDLTKDQQELCIRLSEIEQEDANRCANCGGEDCICCEYYHDRQRWKSPEELFSQDNSFYDYF